MRKVKILLGVLVVVAMTGAFIYANMRTINYNKKIQDEAIAGVVTKLEGDTANYKISYTVKLKDGKPGESSIYGVTFNLGAQVTVGDSLNKPSKSATLSLYKKKDGAWQLYKTFKAE